MKITKLTNTKLFKAKLITRLKKHDIELYDVEIISKSAVKFRARRTFNKPYCGGGIKYGQPIGNFFFSAPKLRQTKHLHWEEWALVNNTINEICDEYGLNGTCRSWFDGCSQYIRKDGVIQWYTLTEVA